MEHEQPTLFTLPTLARQNNVTVRQAEYAVQTYQIEPLRRLGITRLFDSAAADRLRSALTRTGARTSRRRGMTYAT